MATYTFYFNKNPPDGSTMPSDYEIQEEINEFPYLFLYRATKSFNWKYTGYKFVKWNDAADGSGTSLYYGDGFLQPEMSSITNKTWYAIWEEDLTYYLTTDVELSQVANAIRTKGGTSAPLAFPTGFVSAIGAISGGGGLTVMDLYEDSTTIKAPQNYSDLFFSASATGLNIAVLELESAYNTTAYLFQPFSDAEAVSADKIYFVGSSNDGAVLIATFVGQGNGFTLNSIDYDSGDDATEDWGTILSCRIYHI